MSFTPARFSLLVQLLSQNRLTSWIMVRVALPFRAHAAQVLDGISIRSHSTSASPAMQRL